MEGMKGMAQGTSLQMFYAFQEESIAMPKTIPFIPSIP
jgi:hypothetical protein